MLSSKKFTYIPLPLKIIILCCIGSCYSAYTGFPGYPFYPTRLYRLPPPPTADDLVPHWQRPNTIEFPHVWHRFHGRDLNNKSIEYRIEDLNPSRIEDVLVHLRENYLRDEPLMQIYGVADDEVAVKDMEMIWRAVVKQKMALVCYKEGSNEIVGTNINYVDNDQDKFVGLWQYKLVKSNQMKKILGMIKFFPYFNPFVKYNVTNYLTSNALTVDEKYRGRGIGEKLLNVRKDICKEFSLNVTLTAFTSTYSNQCADRAGFKTILGIKFADVAKDPDYTILKDVKAKEYNIKALTYE